MPRSTELQPLDDVQATDLMAAVEAAVAGHLAWLGALNRTLIWPDGEAGRRAGDGDLTGIGAFGAWYIAHQHAGLVDQPTVRDLAQLDRDLRALAATLLAATLLADGTRPEPATYGRLLDLSASFLARARRLEKAFARAAAEIDALTGLQNRQAMDRALAREHGRFERMGEPCAIAFADLDRFKRLNDTHGHAAGDRVLRRTADVLIGASRAYDSVYRYGGEEFLLLLPGTDEAPALEVLERLRRAVAAERVAVAGGETASVTASFGLAMMRAGEPVAATLERADQALYRAKQDGRDRVVAAAQPVGR